LARTPLFRVLERSLRLARVAASVGRSPRELAAELREGRAWTRREFLRTSGITAVGLGLTGCRASRSSDDSGPPPPGPGDPQVVIVGAGMAGLTAGWRLKQAGVRVRILEAQNRVGGRMFSLRDHFPHGQVAELGGELINTEHTHIRSLAMELGLELDDLLAKETMEEELWFFEGRPMSENELLDAFRPVAAKIDADLASLHDLDEWPWASYRNPNGAEALDRTTLAQWLESTEMEPWFRRLLDVGFTTEYGLETDRQSALNLLFLVESDPDEFLIYGEGDERFRVRGGNDLIPRALAERLDAEIETGSRLTAVRERPDGHFDLTIHRDQGSRNLTAPWLVLALPFTLLRELETDVELPPAKHRAIHELGYGTNAKLMMGFRERVWRTRHGSSGSVLSDLPFQVIWDTSREQPGVGGILTNFTGGRHGMSLGEGSAPDQARRAVQALESVYPGIGQVHDPEQAVRFHWPTHAWSRGSYACYLPGQWTGIGGAEGEPVRRLYFAGEHTSLEAQGFMEGGCESGDRVAEEILQALGRARSQPASQPAA